MVQVCLEGVRSRVVIDCERKAFPVNQELEQGDSLSLLLFNLVFKKVGDYISGGMNFDRPIKKLWYADDLCLTGTSREETRYMCNPLLITEKRVGPEINEGKTKYLDGGRSTKILLRSKSLDIRMLPNFSYL